MIPCRTQVWKPSALAERMWVEKWEPWWKAHAEKLGVAPMNDVEKLTATANVLPFGHPVLPDIMICCWQFWWGEHLTRYIESQGIINHWLVRMVRELCRCKLLDILGAASSGKSYVVAAYGYTLWKLRPHKTSVFLSTTSAEAGESRMWGFVKELHGLDSSKVGKKIDSLRLITLDEEVRDDDGVKQRDFKDVIKCVSIKPGQEGNNVIAAICGRKNDRVFWGCDEMDFMDLGVLNARVSLIPNPFSQFVGLNNAPEEGHPMYIDAEPHGPAFPDGWRSVDKDVHEEWTTRNGKCIYFNSDKCPNVLAKDPANPPFPKLMTAQMRAETIKTAGGIDTPMGWKYIYGFPPSVDIPNKVLTHRLLENNKCFEDPVWADARQEVFGGLDLGFKEGGDPCVIHFGKVGTDTRAKKILGAESDGIPLIPSQKDPAHYEKQIAVRVIEECRRRGCKRIALDVTGDGGKILQAIEREAREQKYTLDVLAVSFSGTAEDRVVVPGDKRTGKEMFRNMVAQLWVGVRLCAMNGVIRGLGERSGAKDDLCSRKGTNDDKKRFEVEPKKEMKKRIKRSPDKGDAFALLVHLALKHGLSGEDIPKPKPPFDPQKELQKLEPARRYSQHPTAGSRYTGR